jgi:hypothetical protein
VHQERNHVGKVVRSAAFVLGVAMAGAGAWPACDLVRTPVGAEVGSGPTFGAEISVAIKGRGRVVSEPAALDCPSSCFARIIVSQADLDASDEGLVLTPQVTIGSHFVGWTYEAVELGVRAGGPSQCSPMRRATTVLPVASGATRLVLKYGETTGTPPAGLEAECAEFTTVPVAYALTATFEEDAVIPGPRAPGPANEVLFEPPILGIVASKEIGVLDGRVYWRFDQQNLSGGVGGGGPLSVVASGVASGQADGKGPGSIIHVPPFDIISRFDVDRHVVFQHSSGLVESIQSGSGVRTALGYVAPCASLASDTTTAYCRGDWSGTSTYLWSMPISDGGSSYVYTLPRGRDLAIDDENFYFSEIPSGTPHGQATVESATRFPDGGGSVPVITKLVAGQTAPFELTVGPEHLFWLDEQPGGLVSANTAPKLGEGAGLARPVPGGRFLAVDPSSPTTFYVGITNSLTAGDSYIVKASVLSAAVTSFRAGLTGLGGIAVDATHVFWTQNDGRVYRAPKAQ